MLKLEDFDNKFKGQDIYVIGSGKSLDFIDNSFFENKITIGINQVYKKIKCTYLVRKDHRLTPLSIEKNPDTVHFLSQGNCGGSVKTKFNKNLANMVIFPHLQNDHISVKIPKEGLVVSWSTITTGIHLAAYMGAKNIILVGHDCGKIDGQSNVKNYHTDATRDQKNARSYEDWLTKIENQTIQLKNKLKEKYNCNIYSLNPFINFGLEGHKFSRR